MLNIKFKGILKDENALQTCEREGAVIFKEPNDVNSFIMKGVIKSLPIYLAAGLIVSYIIKNMLIKEVTSKYCFIALISSILGLFILQFVHEIIHAIFFPKDVLKQVWSTNNYAALFVYCTEPVSKSRFIWISYAPNVILGMLPLMSVLLFGNHMHILLRMILTGISSLMLIVGMGDYLNANNASTQVPKKGKIFNSGMHSYWLSDGKKTSTGSFLLTLCILVFTIAGLGIMYYTHSLWSIVPFFTAVILSSLKNNIFYQIIKFINIGAMFYALFFFIK